MTPPRSELVWAGDLTRFLLSFFFMIVNIIDGVAIDIDLIIFMMVLTLLNSISENQVKW